MLNFLNRSRKYINVTDFPVCIVIGNESCDLDSAVSALSLAHFYQEQQENIDGENGSKRGRFGGVGEAKHYLPVLNIPRRDYQLKTEVKFVFDAHAIREDDHLTFRDDLLDEFVGRSECILVDHHVSPLAAQCVEVFDHRPYDAAAALPADCQKNVETVGSCATLIAELMLRLITDGHQQQDARWHLPMAMLRCAIVLDTVNFSLAAGRTTAKDAQVCNALEQLLPPPTIPRAELFDALVKARANVSSLTALQLLRKDLKLVSNADDERGIRVAMPGFPLRVQDFIKMYGAAAAVQSFANETKCSIVLLLGMFVKDDKVQRDIGLIDIDQPQLCAEIRSQLLRADNPVFGLQEYCACTFMEGQFYEQRNIKATRKHILPVVKSVLMTWPHHDYHQ